MLINRPVYGLAAIASASLLGLVLSVVPPAAVAADLALAADQPTAVRAAAAPGEDARLAADVAAGKAIYIVQLAGPPVATYEGGVPGLAPTSPRATGAKRLNTRSPASRAYARHLEARQNAFVNRSERSLGRSASVEFTYQHAFNGVAMALTAEEAAALAQDPEVVRIAPQRFEVPLTDAGPEWIGAPSVWASNVPPGTKGEGLVIAVLDTGINHDHPSFAAVAGDGYVHTNPLGAGNYVPGSYCEANPDFCNDKLIGAWTFVAGPSDPFSPEDSDGHGSHTAGTAAGNTLPDATLVGPTASLTRAISGVAPRANIIAYDVCIVSCPSSALLAAVNQVVIDAGQLPDGIHALNYSISGGNNPYNDAVELAFLNATAAGVFVATSAGNAGPGPATTGHNSPWVLATAALTHNRTLPNTLQDLSSNDASLGDIVGAGFTSGYGPAPIIHARDYPTANGSSNDTDPGQCLDPFPAGHFSGEIVVCDRGTIARVDKGANVLAGGAGGMVLANTAADGESLAGDAHYLPAVHIGFSAAAGLAAWLDANTGTMASISGYVLDLDPSNGDIMAGFSSRGPNSAIDILKPDVGAPGVDILAAYATDGVRPAPEYQFVSGTSMASPHAAGAAALVAGMFPELSTYAVKSLLMMTANPAGNSLKEDRSTPTDPFDVGAGRINLERIGSAALVLDESPQNFLLANPALGGDPRTLNIASMQDGACVGSCGWTRQLTHIGAQPGVWNVSYEAPEGLALSVSRPLVSLGPGGSSSIRVDADTTLASPGWNFATLTLTPLNPSQPELHLPIAVNAVAGTDPGLLSKTVDKATAARGDVLSYEINIVNGTLADPILMTDVLPQGLKLVSGSLSEEVTGGETLSPLSFKAGVLSWSGILDPGALELTPSPAPFGFFPLASLGVAPFPCPSNCVDGGFILNVPSFVYNNESYSQVIWSVNGTLEAGTASGLAASFINRELPDPAPPNNVMAPFWTDLDRSRPGAAWYVATLNAGPNQFTVYEWNNVPLWGDDDTRVSFQIWVQTGASGNIWFVYGQLPAAPPANLTVGVENADGTIGSSYYFDGAGVPPAVGTDLVVDLLPGGTAKLGFEAEVRTCRDTIVNRAEIASGATTAAAVAVTRCE
jgi:uncharacterized repeat protein (TIGR01451 family)